MQEMLVASSYICKLVAMRRGMWLPVNVHATYKPVDALPVLFTLSLMDSCRHFCYAVLTHWTHKGTHLD